MKRRAGFTLLELLVATMIMGIAVVGTLSGISTATRTAARLLDRDRAVLLARTKMNELLVSRGTLPGAALGGNFEAGEAGGKEAGWNARIVSFERPRNVGPSTMVQERIELEVWWMNGPERRSYGITGYRTRTLTVADFPGGPGQ